MINTVIYGAGVYADLFCSEIESNNIAIDFFIDQYSDKKNLCGKPVYRLDDLPVDSLAIYISMTNPMAEQFVIKQLKELGAYKIYSFIDTLNQFPNIIKKSIKRTKMWYADNKKIMIDQSKLNQVYKLLSDEKSKQLLNQIIKFRETLLPEAYLVPDLEPQYFPSDIDLFSRIEKIKFVDGGGYIGDTVVNSVKEFERLKIKVSYIASFEPNLENLPLLKNEVFKQKKIYQDIDFMIYPCGLWSKNQILLFNCNNASSGSVVGNTEFFNSNINIMVTTIDTSLIGTIPNYIKLDIEGSEREALLGAKETIANTSPVLAISLYHKPHDVWDLPLLIHSMKPGYDMFIRIYGQMGVELVLYCVPRKPNDTNGKK